MALELTGIENVGEFYSGHYLSAVLEGDLKAIFAKWKQGKDEDGTRPPNEALAGLANRYFTARSRAEDDGENYLINGQKTWTSQGHWAACSAVWSERMPWPARRMPTFVSHADSTASSHAVRS